MAGKQLDSYAANQMRNAYLDPYDPQMQMQLNQGFGNGLAGVQSSASNPYIYVTATGTGHSGTATYALDVDQSVLWNIPSQPQPQSTKGKSPNLAWLDRRIDEMLVGL